MNKPLTFVQILKRLIANLELDRSYMKQAIGITKFLEADEKELKDILAAEEIEKYINDEVIALCDNSIKLIDMKIQAIKGILKVLGNIWEKGAQKKNIDLLIRLMKQLNNVMGEEGGLDGVRSKREQKRIIEICHGDIKRLNDANEIVLYRFFEYLEYVEKKYSAIVKEIKSKKTENIQNPDIDAIQRNIFIILGFIRKAIPKLWKKKRYWGRIDKVHAVINEKLKKDQEKFIYLCNWVRNKNWLFEKVVVRSFCNQLEESFKKEKVLISEIKTDEEKEKQAMADIVKLIKKDLFEVEEVKNEVDEVKKTKG